MCYDKSSIWNECMGLGLELVLLSQVSSGSRFRNSSIPGMSSHRQQLDGCVPKRGILR